MGLENAQAVYELDIERVFPTHIPHVFNRRILGRSKWDFGVLGRLQNRPSSRSSRISSTILLSIFSTSICFHRIQTHTPNAFTIYIESLHMPRSVIATPPAKKVTATTNQS